MRFFDASALVKRYVREPGSARVRRLLEEGGVAVARLSEVEVVSALARLAREGGITTAQRDRAAAAFVADLSSWMIVEVTPAVTNLAQELLLRHPLRSGDAIQLGSALMIQESVGALEAFVAQDVRLTQVAASEKIRVLK